MSYQDQVCETFTEVLDELRDLPCEKEEILPIVVEAIAQLNSTYRPLLDGYYAGEYCKEVYCNVRDYRDTALTYLDYAELTLQETNLDECGLNDVFDYIHEAVCWIEKAQTVLCECEQPCEDSCATSCEDSCATSCEDSCETTCEDSCETTCEDSCETTCEVSCETTCEDSCETTCEDSCC